MSTEKVVRMGFIGMGGRGTGMMLGEWMYYPDVVVTAVCDQYADRIENAQNEVEKKCGKRPFGTDNYHELLARDDVDAVYIATDWCLHIEIAIAAMKAGKAVAMEVGGARSVQDCFNLVKTWEETKTPFMFMENCCFDEREMVLANMVRDGVFGTLVHLSGAYAHDLRDEITGGRIRRHYRLGEYTNRNCENYPTHELGPIAKLLGINEGNRFVSLVSVATGCFGLHEYANSDRCIDKTLKDRVFAQGDVVTTILTTEKGQTVELRLDTSLPRMYNRALTVHGTKALYEMGPETVFVEGSGEEWDYMKAVNTFRSRFYDKYLPDCWKQDLSGHGHGGMDALEIRAFLDAYENGTPMPVDVYDAAVWMAVTPLSEASIAQGGMPQVFPDFGKH